MRGHGDDPLLSVLPEVAWVHTTHVESVLESPPGATIRGTTTLDPHHVFALGETVWGVQFHPEFDDEIMRFYIAERRDPIRADGLDPDVGEADTLEDQSDRPTTSPSGASRS